MSLRSEMTGAVDRILSGRGRARFVLMSTPHFLSIPFLLRGLAAVAAVPTRLAQNCAEVSGLTISPLPFEIEGYDVSMLWHMRTDSDPAQSWLRDLFRKAVEPLERKRRKSVKAISRELSRR
jgi:DNA-binding transcriptional LysR family regulator